MATITFRGNACDVFGGARLHCCVRQCLRGIASDIHNGRVVTVIGWRVLEPIWKTRCESKCKTKRKVLRKLPRRLVSKKQCVVALTTLYERFCEPLSEQVCGTGCWHGARTRAKPTGIMLGSRLNEHAGRFVPKVYNIGAVSIQSH